MDDKILSRIQKLLALANDKGATEAEAALALEKAYAILAEHNLTMDAVQGKGGHVGEKRKEQQTSTNWSEKYYTEVWYTVCQLNACFFSYWRPDSRKRETKMYVFGRESNVVLTTTMADYLCQTMRRLSREAAKKAGRSDFAFINTYLYGMAERLTTRIWELKHQAERGQAKGSETGTNLPALANFYESEYAENYKAKYGVDLAEARALRAANRVVLVEEPKAETEKERRKREKEEERRREQERRRQEREEDYFRRGGGYNKGYRDADGISLNRQVDRNRPADPDAKKLN